MKEEFVEVTAEPMHREVYRSEFIRAYRAEIPPGAATLFHRHSSDTVYIVLRGGRMKSVNYPGYKPSRMIFSKTFDFVKKVRLALELLFTGFTRLPDGMIFMMLNRELDCVHQAVSSHKNPSDALLLGVEVNSHRHVYPVLDNPYRMEYRNSDFSVFSLKLKKGKTAPIPCRNSFFVVCLEGIAVIDIGDSSIPHKLKKAEFLPVETNKIVSIGNQENSDLQMVIIAF